MSGMRAMVLAAGRGERMRPVTDLLPKPMLPIANIPVMGWVLQHLARHGFTNVIANIHHLAETIVDHFGSGGQYGVDLSFSYEEDLMGSAGGVKQCMDFFDDETFLVIGADDLTAMDLSAFLAQHRSAGALASIGLVEVENTAEFGVVVTDVNGRIQRFIEKPKGKAPSNLANTQIYLFEREILDFVPPDQPYDFGFQAFPAMVDAGVPFYGFKLDGYWRDIGSLDDYIDAQADILESKLDVSIPGTELSPGVWVGDECAIDATARLKAPLILGGHCRVESKAQLGGGTAVGSDVTIENEAFIERSVIWGGLTVQRSTSTRDAVVTSEGVFRG